MPFTSSLSQSRNRITMSLPAILANTQTPHQPFLIICDTPTLPAHALIRDLVRRNIAE